jgi:CYTH domain-containing protein
VACRTVGLVTQAFGIERTPGRGRYARPEIERRYRVTAVPNPSPQPVRLIDDLYLDGLRLRLRRIEAAGTVVFKLTQKIRAEPADPHHVSLTNIYLDADEYGCLCTLPGHRLTKTRQVVGELPWCVDTFHGHLEGLVLAEVELAAVDSPITPPGWLGAEVTHDDRFSGGRLAGMTSAEVAELLG